MKKAIQKSDKTAARHRSLPPFFANVSKTYTKASWDICKSPPCARRMLSLQWEPRLALFFSNNEQRRIRHDITRSSFSHIYIICATNNVQYIAKTKRHLSDIFGERRRAIEKQHIDQPTAVSDHFSLPAHSMDNIELVPLELVT